MVRESDKDAHFYTELPSATVFNRLLEYLSPDGRATTQKWASDCAAVAEPREAKWRDLDSQIGRPASLSQADELFLMLVRLNLNLKEYDFAQCFEISQLILGLQDFFIIVIFALEYFLANQIMTQLEIPCQPSLKNTILEPL